MKNIVTRAFRYFTFDVEHQRFDAARLKALDFGHDVVEVVQRFDS